MDEKNGQPRGEEGPDELRERLAIELAEARIHLADATDTLRRAADLPALVRAEVPRRLKSALGAHPVVSTLAFALAGFVVARVVLGRRNAPPARARSSSSGLVRELVLGTAGFLLKPALKEIMVNGLRSHLNRTTPP